MRDWPSKRAICRLELASAGDCHVAKVGMEEDCRAGSEMIACIETITGACPFSESEARVIIVKQLLRDHFDNNPQVIGDTFRRHRFSVRFQLDCRTPCMRVALARRKREPGQDLSGAAISVVLLCEGRSCTWRFLFE